MSLSADPPTVEIVPYRPAFAEDFNRLNRAWLEKYFTVEPLDEAYLSDPEGRILRPGGEIFFAVEGDRVIGTCAAVPQADGSFELAKLAVTPEAQGRGLGRALALAVIAFAKARGARRVVLVSNSALVQALRLYETLGFRHQPLPETRPYADADVSMELVLEHG
jgi:ribosomal protein S18 acetylase RimI-like enzyme